MKKLKITLILILFLSTNLFSQMYFDLGLEEGVIFSGSRTVFVSDIISDIAYILPTDKKNALIMFYKLKYAGPGLGNNAETKFSERSQDHYVMLKYLWKISKELTVKPTVNYLKEFYKLGKNEEWGNGLYDYSKYGFGFSVDSTHLIKFPMLFSYNFQIYKYPNYSDLLTLFLTGLQDEEPMEDYKNHNFSLNIKNSSLIKNLGLNLAYNLNLSLYDSKKVIQPTGYSGTKMQSANDHLISLIPQYKLNQIILGLNFAFRINNTDQNYISGFDPQNIQFKSDYYSYTSFQLKPHAQYALAKNKYTTLHFGLIQKKYKSREAQDTDGNYLADKMITTLFSAGLIYTQEFQKHFTISPSYLFTYATSNNKYQKAVDYDFNAHSISVGFNYKY